MARVAPNLPAETDLLCEFCGYTLNGLPTDANCPECGKPAVLSIAADVRQLSGWERDRQFWRTTWEVIVHPTRFFRTTATRGDVEAALRFGAIHTAIASALFAAAGMLHLGFPDLLNASRQGVVIGVFVYPFFSIGTYVAMSLLTQLAARLSTWEATYRGMRLPINVVRRGLAFHAAHYLPVGIIAVATTSAYQIGLRLDLNYWSLHAMPYLYVLSGEVIIGAGYLFNTYWIAMRNTMYANH